jgi:hypothetical protein
MKNQLRRVLQFVIVLFMLIRTTSASLMVVEATSAEAKLNWQSGATIVPGPNWLNANIPAEVDDRYGPWQVALSRGNQGRVEGDMQLANQAYWRGQRESRTTAWPSCPTPMSLMLHSSYGAARMEGLAEAIQARGWVTITYRQAAEMMRAGECPPPFAVIVSIDDLGTSWLRPDFKAMIQVFLDRGLTLVLGVVVGGQQDPEVWEYLRMLQSHGVEIASHTISHFNLPELDDEALLYEIQGSYDVICQWMGRCPITLILPFGNGLYDERIPDAASDYTFVAGIPAGTEIGGGSPYYLGRIGPDVEDADHTLTLLYNTFIH